MHDRSCKADLDYIIETCRRIERSKITCFPKTDHSIVLFFNKADSGEYHFTSGYRESKLLYFSTLNKRLNPGSKLSFSSLYDYIRTGLDYYIAYHHLKGARLMQYAAALGFVYQLLCNQLLEYQGLFSSEIGHHLQQLLSKMDGKHSVKTLLNRLEKLILQSDDELFYSMRTFIQSELYARIRGAMESETPKIKGGQSDPEAKTRFQKDTQKISEHIIKIYEQEEYDAADLLDRLLYFNPAVVSPRLVSLLTTEEGQIHLQDLTYDEYCGPIRYQIPTYCLLHLFDSGFLSDNRPIPQCHLQKPGHSKTGPYCKAYPYNCPQWDPTYTIILREE